MYKSSSLTFVYKYLFPVVWTGMFLTVIVFASKQDDAFAQNWSRGAAVMVCWAAFWLALLVIRLRRVEAGFEKLVIKTMHGPKTVDYKDVEWVSQPAMINPTLISLKYFDRESGTSKKILIMPPTRSQLFRVNLVMGELEMTAYIRQRIMAAKPRYSKELEPSRWLPAGLIFLSGVPVALLTTHFFGAF
ncbi:MAG TPA: hypothetical protein VKA27_08600 [Sunxiuqinia sp.]|nr:hypothetical protein [Sunxiuqinia sp.]